MTLQKSSFIDIFLKKLELQEIEDSQLINLNANENQMSCTARAMLSSRLSDRYNLGTPIEHKFAEIVTIDDFTFKGLKHLYELERLATEVTLELFHSQQSEFRLLSGVHAMIASIISFTEVGDTVYSIDYMNGGHFATHYVINRMGRIPRSMPIDKKDFSIDLNQLAKEFVDRPPKMIYFDMGCPLFPIPIETIRKLAGPETIIVYDASHTLGLIAGGKFQDPLTEGADILQGNTHKTFPGPQKAIINFRTESHAQKICDALNQGLVSNRHNHHDLALYVTIFEMREFGAAYAEQMLLNAQSLANSLTEYDIHLLGKSNEFTQSHLILIEGTSVGGYLDACRKLMQCNIGTNSRRVFGVDAVRIGVQEVTRRGMKEQDMKTIAYFFKKILKDKVSSDKIKSEIIDFNHQFDSIAFSFDATVA
jgi:glycine/serine hydroxymethyltransferase